jgi:hypothetical protein
MRFPQTLLAAVLAAVALAAPAGAQEVQVAPGQTYVHAASGMQFPAQVGDFVRGRIHRYGPDDESAGYHLGRASREITITVYVYPSPALSLAPDTDPVGVLAAQALMCSAQFDTAQQEIDAAYDDETLIGEGSSEMPYAGAVTLGHTASYNLTAPTFWGRRNVPVRSDAYLYCYVGGRWSVKYRISYPASADVSADIAALMRVLPCTMAPAAPAATTAKAPPTPEP